MKKKPAPVAFPFRDVVIVLLLGGFVLIFSRYGFGVYLVLAGFGLAYARIAWLLWHVLTS
ncbi:MAG: hypothetical protein Q4G71_14095 [Pseudomonadota bacterium]|nr:hypothetical protein [Pseudomonadota bacterium]